MSNYYIDTSKGKDGPHDLITIMRRIRAGKITFTTPIYIDHNDAPIPAGNIPEIFPFFDKEQTQAPVATPAHASYTLSSLLGAGWRFTMEHNIMTVFAGGMLLVSLLMAFGLIQALGMAGVVISWCLFITFHHIYMVFVLRMYRGQPVGQDFIDNYLAPVLLKLVLSCVLLALMMAVGWVLVIIPGMLAAMFFIFTPFIIIDQRCGFFEALKRSMQMFEKHDYRHVKTIGSLVLLHLFGMAFIIPLPLTLPLFSAALSELYEALSNS